MSVVKVQEALLLALLKVLGTIRQEILRGIRQQGFPAEKIGKVAYAVICGRVPGVYTSWLATSRNVNGFSSSVYKGYTTEEDANDAYQRAVMRGAVYSKPLNKVRNISAVRRQPESMHTDVDKGSVDYKDAACVVVFRGLGSGVFDDWLDCAELVVAVPGAIFQGYQTRDLGQNAYERARRNGDVQVFSARYS
ncbi:hypothetical protein OBBRIDRAFT_837855 [Obba rivulosa]|uniref:Ribonuclease H1 N-terminal domain-containing protein n=1 Tax=Obba rivulosa TaxID=1052685 RepID=A0A8E2AR41_9APHY|nr:hypothetical protein OBBRIDRAFT_837855 [Obba rivulosa]